MVLKHLPPRLHLQVVGNKKKTFHSVKLFQTSISCHCLWTRRQQRVFISELTVSLMHQLFWGSCEQGLNVGKQVHSRLPRHDQLTLCSRTNMIVFGFFIQKCPLCHGCFCLLLLVFVKPPEVVCVSRFDGDHSSVYAELFDCYTYP